jgi:hypothetical protein
MRTYGLHACSDPEPNFEHAASVLFCGAAFDASYQQIDGTIVDPIQAIFGGTYSHSGANLRPGASLVSTNLTDTNLGGASMPGASLQDVNLGHGNLTSSSRAGANLTNPILAIAFGLVGLGAAFGNSSTLYNANTEFTGPGFAPVVAGWTLVPVPEPSPALLLGMELASLAVRRENR